jgi:hypothetical protein
MALIIQLYSNLGEYLSFRPKSFLKNVFSNTTKKQHYFGRWDELPDGIMENIFGRLNLIDLVRSGGVCKSWRSLVMQKQVRAAPQLPWLVLPHRQSCNSLSFYSMAEATVYNIKLPKPAQGGRCFGCSKSWLMMARGTEWGPEVYLFNPFSGFKLNLPSLTTIPHFCDYVAPDPDRFTSFVGNIVVSSTDSAELIVALLCFHYQVLAFCKPGDEKWRVWEGGNGDEEDVRCFDIMFCEDGGTLCVLVGVKTEMEGGSARSYTTCMKSGNREVMLKVIPFVVSWNDFFIYLEIGQETWIVEDGAKIISLVESDGELLVVVTFSDVHFTRFEEEETEEETDDEDDETEDATEEETDEEEEEIEEEEDEEEVSFDFIYLKKRRFEVLKVDFSSDTVSFTRLRNVGDKMLFLSMGESISLSASDFNGFSGNLIYFLQDIDYSCVDHDPLVYRESGVFYLDDQRMVQSFPSTHPSQSLMCWLTPHIHG